MVVQPSSLPILLRPSRSRRVLLSAKQARASSQLVARRPSACDCWGRAENRALHRRRITFVRLSKLLSYPLRCFRCRIYSLQLDDSLSLGQRSGEAGKVGSGIVAEHCRARHRSWASTTTELDVFGRVCARSSAASLKRHLATSLRSGLLSLDDDELPSIIGPCCVPLHPLPIPPTFTMHAEPELYS